MWITLRKKIILPLKWILEKRALLRSKEVRSKKELWQKMEELNTTLLNAERIRNEKEVELVKARIELLDWVLYGSTKG